jgi:transcriptional regulator with XRE-family HTH domain
MSDEWKSLAGKKSDRELSKLYSVGSSTVRRYRLQQNIPAYNLQDRVLPEAFFEQLATHSDYQLARKFNVSSSYIAELRVEVEIPGPKVIRVRFEPLEEGVWTDETIALLGTMPDPELADRLGVSRTPVKKKRKELGIKAYKETYPEITPEIAAEFGISSDIAIARRLGVSASYVRRARLKVLEGR